MSTHHLKNESFDGERSVCLKSLTYGSVIFSNLFLSLKFVEFVVQ